MNALSRLLGEPQLPLKDFQLPDFKRPPKNFDTIEAIIVIGGIATVLVGIARCGGY